MSDFYKKYYGLELPNFSDDELACRETGEFNEHPRFLTLLKKLQEMRTELGFPLPITSAYRSPKHSIEAAKPNGGGQHTIAAVDIAVSYENAYKVLKKALEKGFTGIGVNQKGSSRFIHIDLRDNPTVWSY